MGVSVLRTLALAGALLASSVTRGGPPEAAPAPRQLDRYGDPLPRGAVARLGTTRLRHPGLTSWVFLPDGKTIITAGRDGLVRYWDIATGRQLRATPGGPDWSASALSPDGRLVAGNDDEGVFVRDAASGRLLKSFPRLFPDELRFAPDGSALLMDGRKALDLASGRALEFLDSESDRAFFSPDGKRIVTAGSNWVPVWVLDRATGRQIYRVGGDTDVAAVSPDGKRMTVIGEAPGKKVMSDGDYCLRVFDFPTGKELARFELEYEWGRDSLAYSPDGKTLACGGERGCSLIDPATGKVLRRLTGRAMRVSCSPDGKLLAAAAGPRLRLWDMTAKRELHDQFGDFPAPVCRDPYIPQAASAVSADGRLVAAVDAVTRDLMLWDTTNERLVRRIPLNGKEWYLQELAFRSGGQLLVALTGEGTVRSWEVATGTERKLVELEGGVSLTRDDPIPLRLSPDGRWLLSYDPKMTVNPGFEKYAIWDTATGRIHHRYPLSTDDWTYLLGVRAWATDGTTAVLQGRNGLTIVAVESGRVRARVPGGIHFPRDRVAISAGGRLVAAWKEPQAAEQKDERLAVWEVATGKEVAVVPAGSARHLAFGLGGRVLLVNDDVKGLRVWDLATGQERPRFPDAVPRSKWWYSRAQGLLTTPDGKRAVAVQPDGTALVWDLTATAPPSEKWTRKQLTAWWVDLASADAGRAWRAIWRLAEVPSDNLVPFFRNSLKPITPNAATVRRLIADLDAADFAVRDKASRELVRQGPEVIPAVRQALKDTRSGEARQRLETILKRLGHHRLRPARLVAVLERVGSAGTRKLLTELAGGPADAPETREAKAALRRLSQ